MKRIICLLLCLLLCGQVYATPDNLETRIKNFRTENGLNESNFSFSYYSIPDRVSYTYNEDAFFATGKLWTLPLHMYYYEQEAAGEFLPTRENPEEFTIGGMTLADCRYHSIILAEDGVSLQMRDEVGSVPQYQEIVNTRYGHIEGELLPTSYWEGEALSARFLMNCLQTVYDHPELYASMMENFRFAQKADAFAGNHSPYDLVQIRGEADGMVCAVAEVSALRPFLIVAFVSAEAGGDRVLADLNDMICGYYEDLSGKTSTTTTTPTVQREDNSAKYRVNSTNNANDEILVRWFIIAFSAAALIAAVVGLLYYLRGTRRRNARRR